MKLIVFATALISHIFLIQKNAKGAHAPPTDSTSFFYKWHSSSVVSIDSLIKAANLDTSHLNQVESSREFFDKYSLGLRAMAVASVIKQTNEQIFFDLNSNVIYLIEIYSEGYCSNYQLYILKQKGKHYFFEAECADRRVKTTKYKMYSFDELNEKIYNFKTKGTPLEGSTCMVTIIKNGTFKSYPLFYLANVSKSALASLLRIRWREVRP
jgi:hypothetical protein